MLKRVGTKKIGKTASHRRQLVMSQLRALFEHGKVETTTPKAKVLKANADRLLSMASLSDARTTVIAIKQIVGTDELVKSVYKYSKEKSLNSRIVKVGFRAGDNAEVSRVMIGKVKVSKPVKEVKSSEKPKEVEKKIVKNKNIGTAKQGNKTQAAQNQKLATKSERSHARSGL